MHCIYFKARWSLQVTLTALATESTHFKLESLVKHIDKCVAKGSRSSGSIIKAFNRQDAHIGVCDKIVIVVLTMCDLTLRILQNPNKTPFHDVNNSK